MNRDWVNRRGLDVSKKVLWVSVGQRVAELSAVKAGGKEKFCRSARFEPDTPVPGREAEFFPNLQL